MRNIILSAFLLASAFQTALGEQSGDWTYDILNNQATIRSYTGVGGAVTVPSSVDGISVVQFGSGVMGVFPYGNTSVTSVTIPNSLPRLGSFAFYGCVGLTSVTMSDRFIGDIAYAQLSGQAAKDYLINALANNDAFVTALSNNDAFVAAVANKIKGTMGNYGIATQGLLFNVTDTLATKTQLASALTESRTAGVNSVLSNPNLWTLYTTSQIQNMAVGDLVLSRQVNGGFVLNYDIEQSTDLQNWTPYQALSLPMTNLPTDKAFVRIKMINSNSNPPPSTAF
jgi:hypothetical protein